MCDWDRSKCVSRCQFGVVIEVNGRTIEDGRWLRGINSHDVMCSAMRCVHINMGELNAIIKGMNMALPGT